MQASKHVADLTCKQKGGRLKEMLGNLIVSTDFQILTILFFQLALKSSEA